MCPPSSASDNSREDVDTTDSKHDAEIEVILKTTGNWWSDIDMICRHLAKNELNAVTLSEERLAMIHKVCNDFVRDIEMELLVSLQLDGSLQLPHKIATSNICEASGSKGSEGMNDLFDTSKLLNALETWKCFEAVADVVPICGGSSLVGSPQQLFGQNDKAPCNCVSPVVALLPFHYRKDGEQKFLDLIDQQLLLLRPKVSQRECIQVAYFLQL